VSNPEQIVRFKDAELRESYVAALLETDPSKLQEKISRFETAIFERLQRASNNGHDGELQNLHDAVHALRKLQVDKLNYPPWKSK